MCSDWIKDYISRQFQELGFFLNDDRLISALENVANSVMFSVEALGGRIFVPSLLEFDWIKPVQSTAISQTSILLELDKGEKHTLDMACKHKADWVIIDEKIGRNVAEYLGLHVTGTLGVLLKAKQQGLIPSFIECVYAMKAHGIYYYEGLIAKLAKTV